MCAIPLMGPTIGHSASLSARHGFGVITQAGSLQGAVSWLRLLEGSLMTSCCARPRLRTRQDLALADYLTVSRELSAPLRSQPQLSVGDAKLRRPWRGPQVESCPWHWPRGLCFHSEVAAKCRTSSKPHVAQGSGGLEADSGFLPSPAGPQSPPPVRTFSLSPVRPWFLPLKYPLQPCWGCRRRW